MKFIISLINKFVILKEKSLINCYFSENVISSWYILFKWNDILYWKLRIILQIYVSSN
jgi:hypothetical protein